MIFIRNQVATILVIEDEIVLLGLISATLRLDGHTILETSNPLEGLEIAKERESEINLVLADVTMTPISGLVFATRLAQQGSHIPMLFMSGHPSLGIHITASLGEGAFIEKPFTAPELRKAVKKSLAKRENPQITRRDLRDKLPANIRTLFRD